MVPHWGPTSQFSSEHFTSYVHRYSVTSNGLPVAVVICTTVYSEHRRAQLDSRLRQVRAVCWRDSYHRNVNCEQNKNIIMAQNYD